jgi:hypothetical protein
MTGTRAPQPGLTRSRAEKALAAIRAQFATDVEGSGTEPTLYEPGYHTEGWSIGWEEGPHEWTYRAFGGGFDDELYGLALEAGVDDERAQRMATDDGYPCPAGVFAEPVNHWCLALYPA